MATALVDINAMIKQELEEVSNAVPAPSGITISTKGKMFTLPDGSSHPGPLQAVILDWRNTRSYYKGIYNANAPEAPTCFASDKQVANLKPAATVKEPQCESCADCTFDQWGSASQGKGKACKNGIKLAVVSPDNDGKTSPWVLTVSPTGIKSFTNYVNKLKTSGVIPLQVATEISFNPNETFPTLIFDKPEQLDEDKLPGLIQLREQAQMILDKLPENDG